MTFPMGPLALEFDQFAAMRLNEPAFHTWDMEVVFEDGAHLPLDVAGVVVETSGSSPTSRPGRPARYLRTAFARQIRHGTSPSGCRRTA